MTTLRPAPGETRQWGIAGAIALVGHAGIAALALAGVKPAEPFVPEPVVLVELPEEASAAVAPSAEIAPAAQAAVPQPATPLPFEVPQVRVPVSPQAVTTPPPAPPQVARPAQSAPQPVAAPAAVAAPSGIGSGSGAGVGNVAGTDPKARQQEMDYFSLVSAHLNRRKTYPAEAKKARQHGVVTVRFTVDRNGAVSGAGIKKSSGHDLLDRATLDLLQRVAPLPRMPSSMQRERVTLSLPIDYSLRTS